LVERKNDKQGFLDLALDRFKLAAEAEAENRRDALDDLEFSIGNQWPMDIKAQRQLDGRPCLTINKLPQYILQVTNEQRQQRPAIQVNPVGDGADVDTAEILQGTIRHIEVNSKADIAYDTGFDAMVRCGSGGWRVVTDWISPETETQEIFIRRIKNWQTVYWDPTCQEAEYEDADFCFIVEDLLAEEFKNQFPESKYATGTASLTEYQSVGDQPANWATTIAGEPAIRIAEYFRVEKTKGDRGHVTRKVHWAKISGLDVLDERDWPGEWIPVIPVLGEDLTINGRRHLAGLVRYAKDPQRQSNFWKSAITERIALAPKAPWLVAEGQIEGHEREWEESNVRNTVTLTWKQTDAGGKPAPPPQRNTVEPGVQGMAEMVQMCDMDLQQTTGLNDANLGRPKPDESGKAVLARQKQGELSTLNFSDNLARAINHTGRILIDLIPKVYTEPRIQRIIRPDQTIATVGLYNSDNDSEEEAQQAIEDEDIKKLYDIGTGRYDVTVTTGPSYQSKRQEAVASMMALVEAAPQIMPAIGDLLVANMDWPQAKEISKRLKKLLPPQLQDNEDQTPEAQLMQAQQQLAALSAQHQQLTALATQQKQIIDAKQVESQAKMQIAQMQEMTKTAVVKMQEATKLAVAQINASRDMNQTFAQAEIDRYQIMHDSAHETALANIQQQHDQALSQAAAEQGQQEQDSDQAHELGMAAVGGQQEQNAAQSNGNGED
jgi:hypothetical protein